jgi:UDP-N-acetylglucosamine--N-acetylmuramyl-(pentapeptide) pyrophosphoryl-undecaprenol N-acetylglucosamine transferase
VARFAANAAVHFEETGRWFRRYEVTGVPVRAPFFALPEKSAGPRTLLLFGGSQGARALNRVLVASLGELKKRLPELRIIHQTGEREFESIAEAYRQAGVEARVSAFIRNMPEVFAEADLIVCRSGASTVAEVAAAGRAAIFVPLPTAADDHQRRNAETLVRQGAALMISEAELTPERFVAEVVSLLDDEARLRSVGAAARRLAHPAAAERIAEMAVELAAQK